MMDSETGWVKAATRAIGDSDGADEYLYDEDYPTFPVPVVVDDQAAVVVGYCLISAPIAVPQNIYAPKIVARVGYPEKDIEWLAPSKVGYDVAVDSRLGTLDQRKPDEARERRAMIGRYKELIDKVLANDWLIRETEDVEAAAKVARELKEIWPKIQETALRAYYEQVGREVIEWMDKAIDRGS